MNGPCLDFAKRYLLPFLKNLDNRLNPQAQQNAFATHRIKFSQKVQNLVVGMVSCLNFFLQLGLKLGVIMFDLKHSVSFPNLVEYYIPQLA